MMGFIELGSREDVLYQLVYERENCLNDQIVQIIREEGSVWEGGPRCVWVCIVGLGQHLHYLVFGYVPKAQDRKEGWSDFEGVAVVKAMVSLTEGKPSEECTPTPVLGATAPNCQNWQGGVTNGTYTVGASGLTQATDKRIAELVLEAITEEFGV